MDQGDIKQCQKGQWSVDRTAVRPGQSDTHHYRQEGCRQERWTCRCKPGGQSIGKCLSMEYRCTRFTHRSRFSMNGSPTISLHRPNYITLLHIMFHHAAIHVTRHHDLINGSLDFFMTSVLEFEGQAYLFARNQLLLQPDQHDV